MPLRSWRCSSEERSGGPAQVSGPFLLSTMILCSCSSHRSDASGGVPVPAGPVYAMVRMQGVKNDSWTGWCSSSPIRDAPNAIAPSLCSVFRASVAHGPPPLSAHLLDDAAVLWNLCCSAQIANKDTKDRWNYRGLPRSPHLQRPVCVCDVWGEMSLQRTSDFKGCQVGLVWLGPRAAAWAGHRVSQVCLLALEVDQSTSDCEGGDSKKKWCIYCRLYHVTEWMTHILKQHFEQKVCSCSINIWTCMCLCATVEHYLVTLLY